MSVLENEFVARWSTRGKTLREVALRVVCGDKRGLALMLGGLCFFGLLWRIGVFITDTNAFLNTITNVADGRLYLAEAPYGGGLRAPGTYRSGGLPFGRNYAIIFLATPVLWLLEGLATVLDPRIVIVAVWCLLLVGFCTTLGRLLDRRWLVVTGSVLAVLLYMTNLAVATPLDTSLFPAFALQVVTMVAAVLTSVVVYRLLTRMYTSRIGLLAGTAVLLSTPVAIWGSVPKRHTFTALLVVVVMYSLYRSRQAVAQSLAFRALAYVCVGIMAWIHAAEALILFLPLVLVDLATAPTNDRQSLAVVATAFLLSFVPFFATNVAITGSPVKPPRMLPAFDQKPNGLDLSSGGGGGIQLPIIGDVLSIGTVFGSLLWDGVVNVVSRPDQVFQTFVRSGFIAEIAPKDGYQAISLTVLESAPLLGGLLGAPVLLAVTLRQRGTAVLRSHLRTPAGAVDLFVGGYAILLILLFMPRLPLHAQLTVRYLHPLFPLGVYALVRLPSVRTAVDEHWHTAVWTYTGTVLIGGQLIVALQALTNPGLGEAIQFHALLALACGTLLAVWVVLAILTDIVPDRGGAVVLALSAGAGTIFVVLTELWYFTDTTAALPIIRVLTETITLV